MIPRALSIAQLTSAVAKRAHEAAQCLDFTKHIVSITVFVRAPRALALVVENDRVRHAIAQHNLMERQRPVAYLAIVFHSSPYQTSCTIGVFSARGTRTLGRCQPAGGFTVALRLLPADA